MMPFRGTTAAPWAALAVCLAAGPMAAIAQQPVPPQEANGLRAVLRIDRQVLRYDGRPWACPPFRVYLSLSRTGETPVALPRCDGPAGGRGVLRADVTGPDGRKVVPFQWSPPPPAAEAPWGSRPEHYVVLKGGQSCELDLTAAFFDEPDPLDVARPRLTNTPLGPVRYGLVSPGDYTVRVTCRCDGAAGGDAGPTASATWRGQVASNAVAIRVEAPLRQGGRIIQYLKKAAGGPKVRPRAVTYFGGPGHEEFVSVGRQGDGAIVAFGNAWGPTMPDLPVEAVVLGRGQWLDVNEFEGGLPIRARQGVVAAAPLDDRYPNKAGVIVRYSADLRRLLGVTRFDWGVADIQRGVVSPVDGSLVICGRGTEFFGRLAAEAPQHGTVPVVKQPGMGGVDYQGRRLSGDCYVAKLSPDGSRLLWAYVFEGHRNAAKMWIDRAGGVSVEVAGYNAVKYFPPDGRSVQHVPVPRPYGGGARILGVSPVDRKSLRGGDYFHGTGREPWRKPNLLCFDSAGYHKWALYPWPGPLVGHDDYRLVSDSAVRGAAFSPKGTVWIYGWSDGGNTVFTRNPLDLTKEVPRDRWGMSLWGAGAGSFAHLIHFDPDSLEVYCYMVFAAYRMTTSKGELKDVPNSIRVNQLLPLGDGALAFSGEAASYLVQTPGCWYRRAEVDWGDVTPGGSGQFLCVFDKQLGNMLFCSATPGAYCTDMCETGDGIAAVFRTEGLSWDNQSVPPLNAVQPRYGGGRCDGMVILLEKPAADGAK